MKKKNRDSLNHLFHPAAMLPTAMFGMSLAALPPLVQAQNAKIEEVLVSAQRREESLQQVPISVASFSQEALDSSGVGATTGLPELVPSVQLVTSGPASIFFIRGVGNSSAGTGEEGANAVYVDGVYMPSQKQTAMKFNNVERVEVLKGPQGTLFGRNSSGGLINVITHDPGQEVEAKVKAGYANYDTYRSQAYLAGPVTDTLSADIALTYTDQQDGWGQDQVTGKDVGKGWDWGVRTKWVWLPNDATKVSLSGEYAKSSDDFVTAFRLAPESVSLLGVQPSKDPYDTNTPDDQFTDLNSYGINLTAEFDLEWATLTSITGTRKGENKSAFDSDLVPVYFVNISLKDTEESYQQEFRLASNSDGPLSWQAGLFLLRIEADLHPQTHAGPAFAASGGEHSIYSTLDTNSYAAFGEVSYALTPSTLLIAGARYTRDELDFEAKQLPNGASTALPIFVEDDVTEEEPTYRLAIRQDISENINLYASYNRGFKSGTFSMSSILQEPVEPQTIDAYEVGMKSELLSRRLRLNLAAFHYEISDYQVRSASGSSPVAILLNAGEVEVDGFEAQFEMVPTDNLRLFGSATWLDSEIKEFPYAPFTYPNPAVCTPGGSPPGMSTGAPAGGNTICIGDAAGNDAPLAPKFAGNVGAAYTLIMGEAGEMDFSVLYSYNDGYYYEVDNRLEQPDFGILNASITYRPTQHLGIVLWGRNLDDETYYNQKLAISSVGDNGIPAAPRTYGIDVKYNY